MPSNGRPMEEKEEEVVFSNILNIIKLFVTHVP
jgi:hypothetical protein